MITYRPPLAASLVAKWFVARAHISEGNDLDDLKLQKLLFLAQSRYLFEAGTQLIKERFEAWKHGPVVETVYHEYSHFENRPIELTLAANGPWDHLSVEAEANLSYTWSAFGVYSGWKLREITHDIGPWRLHFIPGIKHIEIPQEEIRTAWPDFARLEADGMRELHAFADPLAKYRTLLAEHGSGERNGDPSELLDEMESTKELRREATFLHS